MVDAGFLHRDISSGNIMITDQPSPNHGILIDQDYTIPVDPNYECSDEDLDIVRSTLLSLAFVRTNAQSCIGNSAFRGS